MTNLGIIFGCTYLVCALFSGGMPISVHISGLSVYTNIDRICHYLLKPVTCQSSIGFVTQYKQDQQTSLTLSIQNDMANVTCSVSKPQVSRVK